VTAAVRKLVFTPMSQDDAEEIADWRYDPPYDFYDARADETELAHLLDPARRETARSRHATRRASSSASSRTSATATPSSSVSDCARI
jgi:hypothetical protein